MRRASLGDEHCSVARTLDIIGDRWTPLILRDIALGVSRFDALQRDLGISRKVLTQRLLHLAEHEVVERVAYQENPPRFDYLLTDKGRDLALVLIAIQAFGDKWTFGPAGPPLQWKHLACGEVTGVVHACAQCGEEVRVGDAVPIKGPSFADGESPELTRAIEQFAALAEA